MTGGYLPDGFMPERLMAVADARGFDTLERLAEMAGVDPDRAGAWADDEASPSPRTWRKLAAAMRVDVRLLRHICNWACPPHEFEGWLAELRRGEPV